MGKFTKFLTEEVTQTRAVKAKDYRPSNMVGGLGKNTVATIKRENPYHKDSAEHHHFEQLKHHHNEYKKVTREQHKYSKKHLPGGYYSSHRDDGSEHYKKHTELWNKASHHLHKAEEHELHLFKHHSKK